MNRILALTVIYIDTLFCFELVFVIIIFYTCNMRKKRLQGTVVRHLESPGFHWLIHGSSAHAFQEALCQMMRQK